jgi:hypothetical protein
VSDRLEQLRDVLLIQCRPAEADRALELAERPGAGVVVSTITRRNVWALAPVAQRRGRPLLVDAGLYSGKKRRLASERFDPAWLKLQRDAGLAVLSDSGYVGARDVAGLVSILGQARSHGDVIAVLPLHLWWLDRAGGLQRLVDEVHAADVPIALILEHDKDPLGEALTIEGMLTLLRVGVPVIQLRCDVSGLGLLCHGAYAAAVGTTGLRRLYPLTTRGGGRAPIATVVRGCLSFTSIDEIAWAVQANPDGSLWTACVCPTCGGRQLDSIARAWEHEQPVRAFTHALYTLFELRDHLLGECPGRAARQVSWQELCGVALTHFGELRVAGQEWTEPEFLQHWYNLPVPTSTT